MKKIKKLKKEKQIINIVLPIGAVLAILLSIWGPEALAAYADKNVLDNIKIEEEATEAEGYRYSLSSNEKLFILSECLNSQTLPGSEFSELTRVSDMRT